MRTKEEIRKWMQQRQAERKPLPSQEELKRQLGHGFLNNKSAQCAR